MLRVEHLKSIARLQIDMGRLDQSLETAQQVVALGGSNPVNLQFHAELCRSIGRVEEAISSLRRAVRANPGESGYIRALASELDSAGRSDEAIELYWRLFEQSDDLQQRIGFVSNLASTYISANRFDHLIERLTRWGGSSPERQRESAYCLAQAYTSVEDTAKARTMLESIFRHDSEDTFLLEQLSEVSERTSDIPGAVRYQELLCELTDSESDRKRLIDLLMKSEDTRPRAEQMLIERLTATDDPTVRIAGLKRLLKENRNETVLQLAEDTLRVEPDNWEMLYFQGVVLSRLDIPMNS